MNKQWMFWSQILCLEGAFFFSLGLGWALGMHFNVADSFVILVFGMGALSLLVGVILFAKTNNNQRASLQNFQPHNVKLDDSFRAAKIYGEQAPLWDSHILRTISFSIDSTRSLAVSQNQMLVIELFKGPELIVKWGSQKYRLAESQILRLNPNLSTEVKLESSSVGRECSEGLVHFISC